MNGDLVDIWRGEEIVHCGIEVEQAEEIMGIDGVGWAIEQVGQCDGDTGLIAVPAGSPIPTPYDPRTHGTPYSRR
jgi:hypothetical protein